MIGMHGGKAQTPKEAYKGRYASDASSPEVDDIIDIGRVDDT